MRTQIVFKLLVWVALGALPASLSAITAPITGKGNSPQVSQTSQNAVSSEPIEKKFAKRVKAARKSININQLKDAIENNVELNNLKNSAFLSTEQTKAVNEKLFSDGISKQLNGILGISGSELKVRRIDADDLGNKHITYDQYVYGKRVISTGVTVHTDENFDIKSVSGNTDAGISSVDIQVLSIEEAIQIVLKDVNKNIDKVIPESLMVKPAELVYFVGDLAYYLIPKMAISSDAYYIEAYTGKILCREPQIKYAYGLNDPPSAGTNVQIQGNRLPREDGSVVQIQGWLPTGGDYYLYSFVNLWGVVNNHGLDYDPNLCWYTNTSSNWGLSNPAAISVAKSIETVLAYVKNVLKWNSWDNLGARIQCNYPCLFGTGIGNPETPNDAQGTWGGSGGGVNAGIIDIGAGDGSLSDPLATVDCLGHETGHGITSETSMLYGRNESGALDESYADIFGTLVEFWAQPDGSGNYPNTTPGKADWLIGEDFWRTGGANSSPSFLRDMRDPFRSGQAKKYMGTNWYPPVNPPDANMGNDWGGVHENNGVPSYAFYLLSQGAISQFDNDGLTVLPFPGIGITNAGIVAWNANMYYNHSNRLATFADTRGYWLEVATVRAFDIAAVAHAWSAVGVGTMSEVSNEDVGGRRTIIDNFVQIGKPGTTTTFEPNALVTSGATEAIVLKAETHIMQGCEFTATIN